MLIRFLIWNLLELKYTLICTESYDWNRFDKIQTHSVPRHQMHQHFAIVFDVAINFADFQSLLSRVIFKVWTALFR